MNVQATGQTIVASHPADSLTDLSIARPWGGPNRLLERPDWPEAFHLIHNKTRLSYTLEAPSDFPLLTRVNALAPAVRTVLEQLMAR